MLCIYVKCEKKKKRNQNGYTKHKSRKESVSDIASCFVEQTDDFKSKVAYVIVVAYFLTYFYI